MVKGLKLDSVENVVVLLNIDLYIYQLFHISCYVENNSLNYQLCKLFLLLFTNFFMIVHVNVNDYHCSRED